MRLTSRRSFSRSLLASFSIHDVTAVDGRTAFGRIIFEPAILGRVVRRRDDNAVSQSAAAAPIVTKNGMRNDRGRGEPAVRRRSLSTTPFAAKNLKRDMKRRFRQGVGIAAHVKRPVDAL